nr:MAG TPA: hypothetical protein [Caudoviricetes sp.]DAN30093.1 MAG TPA: hypothetical protein [Caudoviricetes sp.]
MCVSRILLIFVAGTKNKNYVDISRNNHNVDNNAFLYKG